MRFSRTTSARAASPAAEWPRHHAHEARSVRLAERVSERLRVPIDCRDVARLAARRHGVVHRAFELRPATLLDLLTEADALRRPERLDALLQACEADACSRPGRSGYAEADYIRGAFAAMKAVDAGAVAGTVRSRVQPGTTLQPDAIPKAIRAARIRAIAQWKRSTGSAATSRRRRRSATGSTSRYFVGCNRARRQRRDDARVRRYTR